MFATRPHVPETARPSPDLDDLLDETGRVIGSVKREADFRGGERIIARVELLPEKALTYEREPVFGLGDTVASAVADALGKAIDRHATLLARARAMEALLCAEVPT